MVEREEGWSTDPFERHEARWMAEAGQFGATWGSHHLLPNPRQDEWKRPRRFRHLDLS